MFLDRDGVLNDCVVAGGHPYPPRNLGELRIAGGAIEACRQLRRHGLLLVGVSNQPDVARGTLDRETVDAINKEVQQRVGLAALLVCPHDDADNCECRKPLPGLLLLASRMFHIDLRRSVMVGDRWRDVEAGRRAGCATIFVDHDFSEPKPVHSDAVVTGLEEAVPYILSMTGRGVAARGQREESPLKELRVEIFADGADRNAIVELARNPVIKGFTTNPTLIRAAGISDFERFARDLVAAVPNMPISFEVFADDFDEMERQALRIAKWGDNVFTKIPVTNTRGAPTEPVVRSLRARGVKLNVTAVFTPDQVRWVSDALGDGPPCFVSVFAGRIADSGCDPLPIMRESLEVMAKHPNQRLIWASPREVLNIIQADAIGCHVITLTVDLLKKLSNVGKGLEQFSLETVRMFHDDAAAAGFSL
ncbi:MAG: transaldolase [Candidatus Dormibacteria bacterium]